MRRSEIRENLFKMVFCVEFHPGEDVDEQRDVYLEQIPELTGEEYTYMLEKFNQIRERIPSLDEKINEASKGWKTERMERRSWPFSGLPSTKCFSRRRCR